MKKGLVLASVVLFAGAMMLSAAEEKAAPADAKGCAVFVCEKCAKCDAKAGKCCEKDLASMHVLAIKDGKASVCACPAACKCTTVKDGKCECGKNVKEVALKGDFVCEKCKVVADKAGKCACGADLSEVK